MTRTGNHPICSLNCKYCTCVISRYERRADCHVCCRLSWQVAPEYRRQGLANKLMLILEEITVKRRDLLPPTPVRAVAAHMQQPCPPYAACTRRLLDLKA